MSYKEAKEKAIEISDWINKQYGYHIEINEKYIAFIWKIYTE